VPPDINVNMLKAERRTIPNLAAYQTLWRTSA
jgi:hypothetical protein